MQPALLGFSRHKVAVDGQIVGKRIVAEGSGKPLNRAGVCHKVSRQSLVLRWFTGVDGGGGEC